MWGDRTDYVDLSAPQPQPPFAREWNFVSSFKCLQPPREFAWMCRKRQSSNTKHWLCIWHRKMSKRNYSALVPREKAAARQKRWWARAGNVGQMSKANSVQQFKSCPLNLHLNKAASLLFLLKQLIWGSSLPLFFREASITFNHLNTTKIHLLHYFLGQEHDLVMRELFSERPNWSCAVICYELIKKFGLIYSIS